MNHKKLTALALSGLLAAASGYSLAGATSPTDPIDTNGPRSGSSSMGQNTDGTTPSPKTSTPGTKGMNNDGTKGSTNTDGGGTNSGKGTGASDDDDDDGDS